MPQPNQIHEQSYVAVSNYQVSGATDSLESISAGSPNYVLNSVNSTNGEWSVAFNGKTAKVKREFRFDYSFAQDGGAVSSITLGGDTVPVNFVVTGLKYWVQTAVTSGGSATLAFSVGGVTISSATAIATDGTAGYHALTPGTVGRTTSAASLVMAVATAALTAGQATLIVEGFDATIDTVRS